MGEGFKFLEAFVELTVHDQGVLAALQSITESAKNETAGGVTLELKESGAKALQDKINQLNKEVSDLKASMTSLASISNQMNAGGLDEFGDAISGVAAGAEKLSGAEKAVNKFRVSLKGWTNDELDSLGPALDAIASSGEKVGKLKLDVVNKGASFSLAAGSKAEVEEALAIAKGYQSDMGAGGSMSATLSGRGTSHDLSQLADAIAPVEARKQAELDKALTEKKAATDAKKSTTSTHPAGLSETEKQEKTERDNILRQQVTEVASRKRLTEKQIAEQVREEKFERDYDFKLDAQLKAKAAKGDPEKPSALDMFAGGTTPRRVLANLATDSMGAIFGKAFASSEVGMALSGAFGLVGGGMALQVGFAITNALMNIPHAIGAEVESYRYEKVLSQRSEALGGEWDAAAGPMKWLFATNKIQGKNGDEVRAENIVTDLLQKGQAAGMPVSDATEERQKIRDVSKYTMQAIMLSLGPNAPVQNPGEFVQNIMNMRLDTVAGIKGREGVGNIPAVLDRLVAEQMTVNGGRLKEAVNQIQTGLTLRPGTAGSISPEKIENAVNEAIQDPRVMNTFKAQQAENQIELGTARHRYVYEGPTDPTYQELRALNELKKMNPNDQRPAAERDAEMIKSMQGYSVSTERLFQLSGIARASHGDVSGIPGLAKEDHMDMGPLRNGLPFGMSGFSELFDKMQLNAADKNIDFDLQNNAKRTADAVDDLQKNGILIKQAGAKDAPKPAGNY